MLSNATLVFTTFTVKPPAEENNLHERTQFFSKKSPSKELILFDCGFHNTKMCLNMQMRQGEKVEYIKERRKNQFQLNLSL